MNEQLDKELREKLVNRIVETGRYELVGYEGLEDKHLARFVDDLLDIIFQYGDTRERLGRESGYQTHIYKQDHPRLEAEGTEIWGVCIAYQGKSIYGDIAGSKAKAEEKLRLELDRLAELKEEV